MTQKIFPKLKSCFEEICCANLIKPDAIKKNIFVKLKQHIL